MTKFRSNKHLQFIRTLPCCTCPATAPTEACHIRASLDGGIGLKPSDKYVVPMCHECHSKQHRTSEKEHFKNIDETIKFALKLHNLTGNWSKGVQAVLEFRRQYL